MFQLCNMNIVIIEDFVLFYKHYHKITLITASDKQITTTCITVLANN